MDSRSVSETYRSQHTSEKFSFSTECDVSRTHALARDEEVLPLQFVEDFEELLQETHNLSRKLVVI